MDGQFSLYRTLLACSLAIGSRAIPMPLETYISDAAAIPTTAAPGPPKASGAFRGSSELLGYNPKNKQDLKADSTMLSPGKFELAEGQDRNPDLGLYLDFDGVKNFQPIRGNKKNPTAPGERTKPYERLNSDLFAPPGTDSGQVPNSKWPLGLSHNTHGNPPTAGWARQENSNDLTAATAMAGVDMRLEPYSYREMHWHKANEWSLILGGSVRVGAVNDEGETSYDDLKEGDVWFFPAGIPHTIQASQEGVEFLLIFDQGDFDETSTFLASELFAHMPKSVLAKNLRADVSEFKNIPDDQLYIFPGSAYPEDLESHYPEGPAGKLSKEKAYTYHFSNQKPYQVPGGTVKIIDSNNFPIASHFAAAMVELEPGAMREIHWHTTSDEWNYFLKGQARITVFQAPDSASTFDFSQGDVGYVSVPNAHYIENTGNETCVFLEMLLAPAFSDVSVGQWLALTPKQVVKETLNLEDETVERLPKDQPYILPGNPDMMTTNFREEELKA